MYESGREGFGGGRGREWRCGREVTRTTARHTETHRNRDIERQRDRQTDGHRHRVSETERHRDRET